MKQQSHILIASLFTIISLPLTLSDMMNNDRNWPLEAKQKLMATAEEFDKELLDISADKHIFLEFYTFNCKFCFQFMPDYNRIYDYFMETYGPEQV
jgi:thiol-disulfide isomerase/thioredoxin